MSGNAAPTVETVVTVKDRFGDTVKLDVIEGVEGGRAVITVTQEKKTVQVELDAAARRALIWALRGVA